MKVSFELSKKDILYFRERLKRVSGGDSAHEEASVIEGAVRVVGEAAAAEAPDFVRERIGKLELLIEMLRDDEWRLEGADRTRILDALVYFADPDDLIPDRIPGIGFLDDAIMIELVVQELTHEIEAYQDFCEYRKRRPKSESEAKLEARRKSLQTRMRRRRHRERSAARSRRSSARSPLGLW